MASRKYHSLETHTPNVNYRPKSNLRPEYDVSDFIDEYRPNGYDCQMCEYYVGRDECGNILCSADDCIMLDECDEFEDLDAMDDFFSLY